MIGSCIMMLCSLMKNHSKFNYLIAEKETERSEYESLRLRSDLSGKFAYLDLDCDQSR